MQSTIRGIFLGLGLFWISLGLLLASLVFPQARIILLFATAAVAVLFGAWFVAVGVRLSSGLAETIDRMHELAQMTNVERHEHVARKMRRRPATAPTHGEGPVYSAHGRRARRTDVSGAYPTRRRSRLARRRREEPPPRVHP